MDQPIVSPPPVSPPLTVVSGSVPPGSYMATFTGYKAVTNKLGPALEWTWQLLSGVHAKATARRLTDTKVSPQNATGKIISGLLGRALSVGETPDLAPCVGKMYLIVVAATANGGSRVESASLPPT
jgi:hypothetical protein